MRSPKDFESVLRDGSRLTSRNFVLRAGPNGRPHARLGIIAGKKAAARAVDRNRIKRLIREAFRSTWPSLGSYDVTVQLRSDLREELNPAIRAELGGLLESFARRIRAHTPQRDRQ
jgi:ribonuclease P protein component